jgi:hypothetical protein
LHYRYYRYYRYRLLVIQSDGLLVAVPVGERHRRWRPQPSRAVLLLLLATMQDVLEELVMARVVARAARSALVQLLVREPVAV